MLESVKMNKKYYTTKYKAKADCIMFLSGENYMIFDDKRGTGKIYSFINSEKIQKILKEIDRIKE